MRRTIKNILKACKTGIEEKEINKIEKLTQSVKYLTIKNIPRIICAKQRNSQFEKGERAFAIKTDNFVGRYNNKHWIKNRNKLLCQERANI